MLNLFLNRKSVLACSADCPAYNHARQLALFLYETLPHILKSKACSLLSFLRGKFSDKCQSQFSI